MDDIKQSENWIKRTRDNNTYAQNIAKRKKNVKSLKDKRKHLIKNSKHPYSNKRIMSKVHTMNSVPVQEISSQSRHLGKRSVLDEGNNTTFKRVRPVKAMSKKKSYIFQRSSKFHSISNKKIKIEPKLPENLSIQKANKRFHASENDIQQNNKKKKTGAKNPFNFRKISAKALAEYLPDIIPRLSQFPELHRSVSPQQDPMANQVKALNKQNATLLVRGRRKRQGDDSVVPDKPIKIYGLDVTPRGRARGKRSHFDPELDRSAKRRKIDPKIIKKKLKWVRYHFNNS